MKLLRYLYIKFQFQKVQLKYKEGVKAYDFTSSFQFQKVQLKLTIFLHNTLLYSVSIPKGSIKIKRVY